MAGLRFSVREKKALLHLLHLEDQKTPQTNKSARVCAWKPLENVLELVYFQANEELSLDR